MNKIIATSLSIMVMFGASWSATAVAEKPDKSDKSKAVKQLPKGLQKKLARGGELPPGWQNKVQKGALLSPELMAASEPVSQQVADAVEAIHTGDQVAAEVIRIQDKVIRVSKGQGTVLDVIDLADVIAGRGMRNQTTQ